MTETPAPRSFDYAAFISDLEPLIEAGKKFDASECRHDSQVFKAWKHEVSDLIHRIERQRYSINTRLNERLFQVATYGHVTNEEQRSRFERDLGDTLHELDVVVSNFSKYGDPKKSATPVAKIMAARMRNAGSSEEEIANALRSAGTPAALIEESVDQSAIARVVRAEVSSSSPDGQSAPGIRPEWPEKPTLPELIRILPVSAYVVLISIFGAGLAFGSYAPYAAAVAKWAESVEARRMSEGLVELQASLRQTQEDLARANAAAGKPTATAPAAAK